MRDYVRHLKVKRSSFKKMIKDVYEIRKTNNDFKDWVSGKMFNLLTKWGYLRQHFEDVETEVWDFTPSKKKLLTDRVLEAVNDMERFGIHVYDVDKYAIVMGETTFFDALKESNYAGPFFMNPVAFSTDRVYHNDPYYGRRAFSWDVHIVPGMEGFAFIPKAIFERKM